MKALSAFYPRILPYLPGCPEPLAAQVLINSAINFCENSLTLRQNLTTFSTVIEQVQYALEPPTVHHEISRVMGVTLDGKELTAGLTEALRGDMPTAKAKPRGFYTDRTDSNLTLMLSPPPDQVYSVVVNVVLRPTRAATMLDDDLYNTWIDPIVSDAIARAMQIPGQSFSNPAQAAALLSEAARLTLHARIEGNYGSVRGSMRIRYRPFA